MTDMRRYQDGTIEEVKTAAGPTWYIRFTSPDGKRPRFRIGLKSQFPTKARAARAANSIRDLFNGAPEQVMALSRTFGDVIERYESEEMPARHSTARGYRNIHRVHIRPRWGASVLAEIKPMDVRQWILGLDLATRTRGHIHAQMRVLYRFAMLWGWFPPQTNPMALFTVPGTSKRARTPKVITPEQFREMLAAEPSVEKQTMLIAAFCLGLRVSELFAMKWSDFDHLGKRVVVSRAIVEGHVGEVKTERSGAPLPLADYVGDAFLRWREASKFKTDADWVFASPAKGGEEPHNTRWLQQNWLRTLGERAKLGFPLGWHTFRHSYKTLLDRVSTDPGIKRDLMRHADIHTTMQVYGEVEFDRMRAANDLAVGIASCPPVAKAN